MITEIEKENIDRIKKALNKYNVEKEFLMVICLVLKKDRDKTEKFINSIFQNQKYTQEELSKKAFEIAYS